MTRNPLKSPQKFQPSELMTRPRTQKVVSVLGGVLEQPEMGGIDGDLDSIDGGWAAAQKRYVAVPKIKEFASVGRPLGELSLVRTTTADTLQELGLELCGVEGVDSCVYIRADEIRVRQTHPTTATSSLMAPIQRAIIRATEEGQLSQQHAVPYRDFVRVGSKDDPAVSRIFLMLDKGSEAFGALQEECQALRRASRYTTRSPESRLANTCFIGELVDYEPQVAPNERWTKAAAVLTAAMPAILVAGPVDCLPTK